ncbi:MAG TPA: hypothetical protein PLG90_12045 [Ignavibacteria bacterium]|nr:hypothetical protein [Ignavibacteria bacterium]
MQLSIELPEKIDSILRNRLIYTFKIFCTLSDYDYTENSEYKLSYNDNSDDKYFKCKSKFFDLKNINDLNIQWYEIYNQSISDKYGIHKLPVFFLKNDVYEIDILAEIFIWISLQFEYVQKNENFGHIYPFKNSLHGHFNLDPKIPYASIWIEILSNKIKEFYKFETKDNFKKTYIINSHDIDFLPKSNFNSFIRLFKNYLISIIRFKDKKYSKQLLKLLIKKFPNYNKLFYNFNILMNIENEYKAKGIYMFLIENTHYKDGNYNIDDEIFKLMVKKCIDNGNEIGLHGSYSTSDQKGKLTEELNKLQNEGINISGVRQHWLRFNYNHYFKEVDENKLKYDMTIGFNETNGFRSGLAAAYPPYDFENETHHKFLEFPLAIMENTLYFEDKDKYQWYDKSEKILKNVYNFKYGGVSILWHDSAFQGTNFPIEFIELYKKILNDKRFEFTDGKTTFDYFKPIYLKNKLELN